MGGIGVWTSDGSLRAPLAFARGQFLIAAYAAGVSAIIDVGPDDAAYASRLYAEAHADGFGAVLASNADDIAGIERIMSGSRL
jgi:citrate lyase beta subunit